MACSEVNTFYSYRLQVPGCREKHVTQTILGQALLAETCNPKDGHIFEYGI